MAYDHLGLVAWPFTVVPRPQLCDFLAGRAQLRDDIVALLRAWSRKDTSSIHILWSWLGAGKTHSLYYLMNESRTADDGTHVELLPVYSEFPKRARGFLDLYQSAVAGIDRQLVVDVFLEATTAPGWAKRFAQLSDANPDLVAAFRTMAMGTDMDQAIAMRWLRGDTLPLGEYRRLGMSQRLATADQAVRAFAVLVELCDMAARSRSRLGHRVVWVLDEFQRVGRCSPAIAREINAGLHSLFNACPSGLTMVLSFSGSPEGGRLPDWLSPELRSRIGATKVMVLPPFQPDEAMRFLREIFARYRTPQFQAPNPYFPFTTEACEYVIDFLHKKTQLRPRMIMHAMNAILEAADSRLEEKSIDAIAKSFAEETLREYVILQDRDDEDDEDD